jgi:rhamnogalacturonyl hydrolase YesR
MKKIVCVISMMIVFIHLHANDSLFNKKNTLATMEKVANWQLKRWQDSGSKYRWSDWTNAAGFTGLYALSTVSKNILYEQTLYKKCELLNWQTGARRFHADDYCVAQTFSLLYMKYRENKMLNNFIQLADSIYADIHSESLDWKNKIENREWAWCDALYMGPTALSYLATATKEQKYLDITVKLWWKTTDYLYDSSAHLYTRDGSYLNKKEKNGQKIFWSRGNGWVLAGLVRVLENMPQNYPDRSRFIILYKDMAEKIASLQQTDGSWHASLLDPESYNIKETSGTGFYTYALLWGLNNKLLDKKTIGL